MHLGGSPGEVGVSGGSPRRWTPQGTPVGVISPGVWHFGTEPDTTQRAADPSAWTPQQQQDGNTAPPTRRQAVKRRPDPTAALNTAPDMGLPSEERDPAAPTGGQAPVPPCRRPAQGCGPTSHARGQTPEARRAGALQLEQQRPETQKVRQNETAEKHSIA